MLWREAWPAASRTGWWRTGAVMEKASLLRGLWTKPIKNIQTMLLCLVLLCLCNELSRVSAGINSEHINTCLSFTGLSFLVKSLWALLCPSISFPILLTLPLLCVRSPAYCLTLDVIPLPNRSCPGDFFVKSCGLCLEERGFKMLLKPVPGSLGVEGQKGGFLPLDGSQILG